MAVKSNLTNMVLVLTTVCLVCAAVLAGVNAVTEEPIRQTNLRLLQEGMDAVLPEGGTLSEAKVCELDGIQYEYYVKAQDTTVVAYAVKSTSAKGFGGPLTVIVGVLPDLTVYNTKAFSHTETPGLGAKCDSDEKFLSQFRRLDPSVKKLSVRKDGGDLDAITASTITSRAYIEAVAGAVAAIAKIQEAGNE